MRVILMGTGPFAVPSFEQLRSEGIDIPVVISRPEVAGGSRGGNSKKGPPPSPVRLWAQSHNLPTAAPESINTEESIAWLRKMDADLLFVCDYGQILSKSCLSAAKLGGINLHGSLLPKHRGAAPVQWSVLAGDSKTGATIIHMTPGLDAGPVLSTVECPIDPHENAQDLEQRLSELGRFATKASLEILGKWDPATPSPGTVQDPGLATKAPRLHRQDGRFDSRYSCKLIDQQIRGLQPWPGVFANILMSSGSSLRLIVQRATPLQEVSLDRTTDEIGELLFGEKLKHYRSRWPALASVELAIRVSDGWMALETVQPAGKRSMSGADFARGYAKMDWMRVESTEEPHPLLERMSRIDTASNLPTKMEPQQ